MKPVVCAAAGAPTAPIAVSGAGRASTATAESTVAATAAWRTTIDSSTVRFLVIQPHSVACIYLQRKRLKLCSSCVARHIVLEPC